MIKNVHRSSCKIPLSLNMFESNVHYLDSFFEKYSNTNFHLKSAPFPTCPCDETAKQT